MKNGPVNLYEGIFYFPVIMIAGVLIAHALFLILWIREYLIIHKKFIMSKSPKRIAKWIGKFIERPFNLSLRWLFIVGDEN